MSDEPTIKLMCPRGAVTLTGDMAIIDTGLTNSALLENGLMLIGGASNIEYCQFDPVDMAFKMLGVDD